MDILITVGIFPPDIGGPASFVPKIAKYLINKGHNVKIICLSDKEHLTYKDDINVIRINRNLPIIFRWLKTILKIYKVSKIKFLEDFKILSVQRSLKIIGIFSRLHKRDNKSKYLKYIPYTWKLLENRINSKNFNELKRELDKNVSKKLRKKIK